MPVRLVVTTYARPGRVQHSLRPWPTAATAAVPGGWIDLTREGFCYA